MRPKARKTFEQVDVALSDLIDKVYRGVITTDDFRALARKKIEDAGWKVEEFKKEAKWRRGGAIFNIPTLPGGSSNQQTPVNPYAQLSPNRSSGWIT